MNVADTIERMTLDLMVKGAIDKKELRPPYNELTRALSGVEDVKDLLGQLGQAINSPSDSPEINVKFQEMLQLLEEIGNRTKSLQSSAGKEKQNIPNRLSYNTKAETNVIESFQMEIAELFEKMEHNLLLLERSPDSQETITMVMGHLHSIKGIAGFLDFLAIQKMVHIAESALSKGLESKSVSSQICDALLRTKDMCENLVRMFNSHLNNKGKKFPKLPPTYPLLYKELLDLAEGIELTESLPYYKSGKSLDESSAMEAAALSISGMHLAAEESMDQEKMLVDPQDVEYDEYTEEDLRNMFGNLIFEDEEASSEQLGGGEEEITDEDKEPAEEFPSFPSAHLFDSSDNVRIKLSKLDQLLEVVGELVIAQSQVVNDQLISGIYDLDLERKLEHLTACTRDLQALGMNLRVFPIQQLFAPLARTARDLAVKLNKDVEVIRFGEDAEVDKSVLQALSDPLMHMVRNAVDHGIESKAERKKRGKPERGRITLSAQNEGGMIRIELQDDGYGLSREKIIKKAKSMGLVKDNKKLNDEAVWELIFSPGFSTSSNVSEISGRGMGMDVVQRSIHRLGGRIQVETSAGKGSKFILTLPLTLAMIEGLMIEMGPNIYIIPRSAISEIVRPNRDQLNTVHGRGEILTLRGQSMPLVRLHEFLNIKDCKREPWHALSLIIKGTTCQFALMVDNVSAQQQVVLKSLGGSFSKQQGISGCSILGDGRVGLVLDPEDIYSFVMNSTVHEVA